MKASPELASMIPEGIDTWTEADLEINGAAVGHMAFIGDGDTLYLLAYRSAGLGINDAVEAIGNWAIENGYSKVIFSALTEAHRRLYKRILH